MKSLLALTFVALALAACSDSVRKSAAVCPPGQVFNLYGGNSGIVCDQDGYPKALYGKAPS